MSKAVSAQKQAKASGPSLKQSGGILQRKCACGTHTIAGGECEQCQSRPLQAKLSFSQPNDEFEREADRTADEVMNARPFMKALDASFASVPARLVQRRNAAHEGDGTAHSSMHADVPAVLASSGEPLNEETRSFMEPRFGRDFGRVRVHRDARAAESAQAVNALAYTVGEHIVFNSGRYSPASQEGKRLLAHELAHVVQQGQAGSAPALQRKVILKGTEMAQKDRDAFLKARAKKWNPTLAKAVMEDMAAATDDFDFADEAELETEIVKRLSTTRHMIESQTPVPGSKRMAFGYPFSGEHALYGPRVNYAAHEYWTPDVVDSYAVRTDAAKNKKLLSLPRNERHTVYGDMGGDYEWKLTDKGKADPYTAIKNLFAPQQPHKRTLIHCDYLVSMVNFLSFADSVGAAEFNKRVTAYGVDKIGLRWNAFTDLEKEFFATEKVGGVDTQVKKTGLGSTQRMQPSSEKDFVIGDHVVFFNHLAYDALNTNIGNAWRLENAILISRGPGYDIFLGHGSGTRTSSQMRAKLAEEYNEVADKALAIAARTKSKNKKIQADAMTEMATRFPKVIQVGTDWRIQGDAELCTGSKVDQPLRRIKPDEVIGPKDPCDQTKMYWVDRPIESAK